MKEHIQQCSACCNDEMEKVLDLQKLPLTGIYIDINEEDKYTTFDQALMICNTCGHIQLKNMLSADYLYKDTYTHKSGESPISKAGNDFFINYLRSLDLNKNKNDSILEIGCNDLYLLTQLKSFYSELVGVDPTWDNKVTKKENIRVLGAFAEDIDFQEIFTKKPNVVISSHTFEHIQDVDKVLSNIVSNVEDGTSFLIEIPSVDTMLKLCRFDQVFHQHFNYFSLHSFFNFIQLHSCEFIDYTMNHDYWGGTMLIHFKRGGNSNKENPFKKYTKQYILNRYEIFKSELEKIELIVDGLDEDIYGFGAAQMLPILAYHSKSNFSFIKAIIDDNEVRCNKKLVGLDIPIVSSNSISKDFKDVVVMVTALDSTKPILNRLYKMNPRYIIKPIAIY